jgi:DNA-binding transcriptional LysR family regulator
MTSRRPRRAKTDRIDGEALVRALLAHQRGEPRVCAMVRVPTPAVEGLGILMTPLGVCGRELERGELVRLLPEWDAGTVELNAVYANGRAAKPSARAFVDYPFDHSASRN